MKAEKVILSFIAIVVGLIAAGIAFYLYQMTKTIPVEKKPTIAVKSHITPSKAPSNENFLTVENPKDESVHTNKTITISGKTTPKSTVIISTNSNDQVVTTASNGDFTLTDTINDGTSLIRITSVFPDGEEKTLTRTVTYSTESF